MKIILAFLFSVSLFGQCGVNGKLITNPITSLPDCTGNGTAGPPTGAAGGVLSGTYPNPGLLVGSISSTQWVSPTGQVDDTTTRPGLVFVGHTGVGGVGFYYDTVTGGVSVDQFPLSVTARGNGGVDTRMYIDNDSIRCNEGEQMFQRGACEFWSARISNNARYWDLTDTFMNWGNPLGDNTGNRAGIGRFSSDGATVDRVHAAESDGGPWLYVKQLGVIFAPGTEPTCDSTKRGFTVMVQGAMGVADTLRVCSKDAADAYAWRTLI